MKNERYSFFRFLITAQVDRLKVGGFRVFEPADDLAALVYRVTAGFPKENTRPLESSNPLHQLIGRRTITNNL